MKQLDTELFLYFNQYGSEKWDLIWTLLTDKYLALPLFGLLLLFILFKYAFKSAFIVGVVMVGLIGTTDLFATIVKKSVDRPRPCSVRSPIQHEVRVVSDGVFGNLTLKNEEKCEKLSFFSSHAAVSFALALFFGLLLKMRSPFWLYGLLIWATLVSISRIYLGFHYPSDILVGAIVGALFGWLFYVILQKVALHYKLPF